MKKIFFLSLFLLSFCLTQQSLYAESITLTTYYPAPFGAYDRLRLVPRAPLDGEGACDPGTIYVDTLSNQMQFCRDDGFNTNTGTWEGLGGVWTKSGNFIYPSDTSSNPDLMVGIGTTGPAPGFRLDVRGKGSFTELTAGAYGLVNVAGPGDGLQYAAMDLSSTTPGDTWGLQYRQDTGNLAVGYFPTSQYPIQFTRTGNVGIGTTSPAQKLEIVGNLQLTKDSGSGIRLLSPNAAADEKLWEISTGLDSLALVAWDDARTVGTNAFHIIRNGSTISELTLSGNSISLLGGNVGIGVTSPQRLLHVGGAAGNTTGVWDNLSDARLKDDVADIKGALDKVLKLRGVTFRWKDPSRLGAENGPRMGLVAQEVETVVPEWVKTDSEGYKWLSKEGVEALLIEAVKEQQVQLEQQRAQIDRISHELETLKGKIP